jgi:hypothetical protein
VRTSGPGQSPLLLLDVAAILEAAEFDYAVIGAMAAAVHGVVRASLDADLLLSATPQRATEVESRLAAAGFQTSLQQGDFEDPIAAVLRARDSYGNQVDLLFGLRGVEPALFDRALVVPYKETTIDVVGREDFVAMKLFAGAPQDVVDALGVFDNSASELDRELLRELCKRFGKSTERALDKMLRESGCE